MFECVDQKSTSKARETCGSFALISSAWLSEVMLPLCYSAIKLLKLLAQPGAKWTENSRVGSSILSLATIVDSGFSRQGAPILV